MTFTEQIIIIIIPLLLPPLISLSAILYQHLLQRMPEKKREIVEEIARTVVPAIEQTTSKEFTGPDKKQKAMELATKILANLHIRISEEALSAMIEAAVFALNQSKGAPALGTQSSPLAQPVAG